MFLPPQNMDDAVVQARIKSLLEHGYVVNIKGGWFLTEKGWRTLSAAAEAKIPQPPRQTKEKIRAELDARTAMGH